MSKSILRSIIMPDSFMFEIGDNISVDVPSDISYAEYIEQSKGKLVSWFKEHSANPSVGIDIVDNFLGATQVTLSCSVPEELVTQFEKDAPRLLGTYEI